MRNILMVVSTVLFMGCQCNGETTLNPIKWKAGSFSDLNKNPVAVILSNSEPNFNMAEVLYKEDYSEKAVRIVDLIKSAEVKKDHPEVPLFSFPEQLWIAFNDGTGSVFPSICSTDAYCIRAKDGIRYSEEMVHLIECFHVKQINHQTKQNAGYEKIQWKAGLFSDLTQKRAVGLIITDAEPNMSFKNIDKENVYIDCVNEDAARTAYLFGHPFEVDDFSESRPLSQRLWVAFADGTGSVYQCAIEYPEEYFIIRSGTIMRRSESANNMFELIRTRNSSKIKCNNHED